MFIFLLRIYTLIYTHHKLKSNPFSTPSGAAGHWPEEQGDVGLESGERAGSGSCTHHLGACTLVRALASLSKDFMQMFTQSH